MITQDARVERNGHKGTVRQVNLDDTALVIWDGGGAATIPQADLTLLDAPEDKSWPPSDLETK